ncbi:Zn-dependent protease with chaperone function [Tenacibaculum sp. MAR_2010_89]|uniref:M48 family metalloprotease n=1 Tax=Tenacibaculum sp. MAR_2010_89 TaxID=1250198 RepID=UPI00089B1B6D|nr:M48 family metallopeptidase [Tenacibaculum sp. MAR_2010_89]SEE61907.1 Zn-dependent protease with chaperone function [Tenacibaculum sp. MAR_2010_89]
MKKKEIKLSDDFKKQTTKAIIAIIFFVFIYMLILIMSVGLTALCVYLGIMLIVMKPMFITIGLGIGLASLGFFILIFLLKFIFKSHKIDRSHLIEITKFDEPELFKLIEEIVKEVDTSFPKKIYLSADVNASVFYNSSFWSMFLPVKKNLQIGLGLVNTISKLELTAILSHEFGHFSQKTMKVGSYVYNVNQVIFNLLFDNESYDKLIQSWANASGYFSIFAIIAIKIVEVIQFVLRQMYDVVNKNYLGLSREMEFHADEIAANVTGYEPLKSSLLRMSLADNSFNNVLSFYEEKIKDSLRSKNLYKEQFFVMNFQAKENNIEIINNLPKVSEEELNKFNKSKLVIKDQWASHPSVEERILMLEKTGVVMEQIEDEPAEKIFKNIEKTYEKFTNKLFEGIEFEGETKLVSFDDFCNGYKKQFIDDSFSKIYKGYYDNKNPIYFDVNKFSLSEKTVKFDELFSQYNIDLVYTAIALQSDIETLKQVADKTIKVKTFDYDGKKFKEKNSKKIQSRLELELEELNKKIKKNDIEIFKFFREKEKLRAGSIELEKLYRSFFMFDKEFDSKYNMYMKLSSELEFISLATPFEQIVKNFVKIKPIEIEFKKEIRELIYNNNYQTEISKEIRENFELYLSQEMKYFEGEKYIDDSLEILFKSINNYVFILSKGYFLLKKNLLMYQEDLLKPIFLEKY